VKAFGKSDVLVNNAVYDFSRCESVMRQGVGHLAQEEDAIGPSLSLSSFLTE
jgi:hypothetical protein